MFRDMADFVLAWPFEHFREDVFPTLPANKYARCLPPVPVIYWQPSENVDLKRILAEWPTDFILATGQADTAVPSAYGDILDNPKLVRWFGQNNDLAPTHPKFTSIPIGLNCWTHGEAMTLFYEGAGGLAGVQSIEKATDKLFFVNFSSRTDVIRDQIRKDFCTLTEGKPPLALQTLCFEWAGVTKTSKTSTVIESKNYESMSKLMYTVSPRGRGEETHRTWQALYSNSVPILKHSAVDSVMDGLPVMFVDDYNPEQFQDTAAMIELYNTKFKPMFESPLVQAKLHRQYYHELVTSARVARLNELELSNFEEERKQCWGYKKVGLQEGKLKT